MADFSALKTAIQTYIKQNGNEEITGEKLQEILLSMVTTLGDSAINDLVTALANEVAARQNADGTLQQNITNEATARGNADTALDGRIDDEATARANGDTALANRLGSTITAENTAADQIGAEAEARTAADTALLELIDGITDNIENGYVYAGIATPSSTPATGKVFYLALTAGTYTNFGNIEVSQGINILKYNGSAWSLDAFIGIDDELTPGSNNLPKSGNVLENIIKNGSAFDLSAYNAVDGVPATYADLDAALAALSLLPAVYKQPGMSFRFVLTSDNKYIQYLYHGTSTASAYFTNVDNWEKINLEKELINSTTIPTELTQDGSYSSYEIGSDNRALMPASTTDVIRFKIGTNKNFKVSGYCGTTGAFVCMIGNLAMNEVAKLYRINQEGNYEYYGKTDATKEYVFITVDKNTEYSCELITPITSKIPQIEEDIEDINEELTIATEQDKVYQYSGYQVALPSDGRYLITNNNTDIMIFNVGVSKRFKITGTVNTKCTICALTSALSMPDFVKVAQNTDATLGSYEYIGQTTATQGYVFITVDKSTQYSCELLEDIKIEVEKTIKLIPLVRKQIHISTSDTQVEILNKLITAYTEGNIDVIWEYGTYTFDDVYQYMLNTLGWTWTMELPIGNNCRYFFNGSTIISNKPTGTYEESRNIFGCKAGESNKNSYELYDGILINNDGTYCVHDECSRATAPYVHKYVNMTMYYNRNTLQDAQGKCIGGGCGYKGYVVIENCNFISNRSDYWAVSWHGVINSTDAIAFNLSVNACSIIPGLTVGSHFKASDKVFIKYANNQQGKAAVFDNTPDINVIQFNNVIEN